MSVHVLKQEGEIVTGYDSTSIVQWCTPSVAGISACISASASGGTVTVTITLKTPVGSFSKSFSFTGNICFTWKPISVVSVTLCISNFRVSGNQICFTLSIKACVNLFIKDICTPTFSHEFCIPLPAADALLAVNEISEDQFVKALLVSHLLEAESSSHCNCK